MSFGRISDNLWQSRWLSFQRTDNARKRTEVWDVVSKRGTHLGTIKWFAPWRQYAFFPDTETIFNADCLMDISDFVNSLMLERDRARL